MQRISPGEDCFSRCKSLRVFNLDGEITSTNAVIYRKYSVH